MGMYGNSFKTLEYIGFENENCKILFDYCDKNIRSLQEAKFEVLCEASIKDVVAAIKKVIGKFIEKIGEFIKNVSEKINKYIKDRIKDLAFNSNGKIIAPSLKKECQTFIDENIVCFEDLTKYFDPQAISKFDDNISPEDYIKLVLDKDKQDFSKDSRKYRSDLMKCFVKSPAEKYINTDGNDVISNFDIDGLFGDIRMKKFDYQTIVKYFSSFTRPTNTLINSLKRGMSSFNTHVEMNIDTMIKNGVTDSSAASTISSMFSFLMEMMLKIAQGLEHIEVNNFKLAQKVLRFTEK